EHPQRVAGRRGVDDDRRVRVLLDQLADAHPRHQLVDAGERQLEETPQLFAIEVRAAVGDLEKRIEVRAQEALVQRLRVERLDLQENRTEQLRCVFRERRL